MRINVRCENCHKKVAEKESGTENFKKVKEGTYQIGSGDGESILSFCNRRCLKMFLI